MDVVVAARGDASRDRDGDRLRARPDLGVSELHGRPGSSRDMPSVLRTQDFSSSLNCCMERPKATRAVDPAAPIGGDDDGLASGDVCVGERGGSFVVWMGDIATASWECARVWWALCERCERADARLRELATGSGDGDAMSVYVTHPAQESVL